MTTEPLDRYREYIERWNFEGMDMGEYGRPVQSRYVTVKKAFELYAERDGRTVVELGTIRSFVHGGHHGCNSSDRSFWNAEQPENWDWGAGCFSRLAAECLGGSEIHSVDLENEHIERCKAVNAGYPVTYHVSPSVDFLRSFEGKIDLLYLDTGDITPIEPSAALQLQEARVVFERDLVEIGGLVLIDDVRNPAPLKFGEKSKMGKAKYSLGFLLMHGFRIIEDEYQVLLERYS